MHAIPAQDKGLKMAENLPILYQNIMFGLPSKLACDAFLWAVERPDEDRMCYRAEAFARDVHGLAERLRPMLDASARIHGLSAHDPDLMQFILTRHANMRFGGNTKIGYAA